MTDPTATASETGPVSLLLEYLNNVSEDDAREYALGYIESNATSKTVFYGVFPHARGYVVEIQEGGSGQAFTPALLQALNAPEFKEQKPLVRAKLLTGQKELFVSVTPTHLSTMVLPRGADIAFDLNCQPSDSPLAPITFDHTKRFLGAAKSLFGVSIAILVLALLFQPSSPVLKATPVSADTLPLAQWVKSSAWPANEAPITVRLQEGGKELKVITASNQPVAGAAPVPADPLSMPSETTTTAASAPSTKPAATDLSGLAPSMTIQSTVGSK